MQETYRQERALQHFFIGEGEDNSAQNGAQSGDGAQVGSSGFIFFPLAFVGQHTLLSPRSQGLLILEGLGVVSVSLPKSDPAKVTSALTAGRQCSCVGPAWRLANTSSPFIYLDYSPSRNHLMPAVSHTLL